MRSSRLFSQLALLAASTVCLSGCTAATLALQDFELPSWLKPVEKDTPGTSHLVSQSSPDCPRVSVMPELSRVTQFADETSHDASNILSETVLTKLDSSCITTEDAINMDIMLNFTSNLGTAGLRQAEVEASYAHPYFIAVVSPQGKIIAKDVFALSPVFTSGQKEVFSSERLQQTIPITGVVAPGKFQIMIGFQLSEEELSYNRALTPLQATEVKPMEAAPAQSGSSSFKPAAKRSSSNN